MAVILRTSVNHAFKSYGLMLRADAAKRVHEHLIEKMHLDENDVEDLKERKAEITTRLSSWAKKIKAQQAKPEDVIVTAETVQAVLQNMRDDVKLSPMEAIRVISAFDQPRFKYNAVRKVFTRADHKRSLHGDANDKSEVLRERLLLLQQRLMRHESFVPISVAAPGVKTDHIDLTAIESLKGTTDRQFIFGVLSQLAEGRWYLEDLTTSVQLDLSHVARAWGMFVDNSAVIVSGHMNSDDCFVVEQMMMPPHETRADSVKTFPQLDLCGLDFKTEKAREVDKLSGLLEERADDMVVIVSDLHLDKPKVMKKLEQLLKGFNELKPPLFVFMGNFTSKAMGSAAGDAKKIKGYFDSLADLIAKHPNLVKNSKFVFIPGPTDPGVGNVLPRPGLAAYFTQRLRDKLPTAVFPSNPCRIMYYNKEFVFFRDDLAHKMRRNCVFKPNLDEAEADGGLNLNLARTVIDQGHLCPLPSVVRPIYWNYDHALRLYPLPHGICLGDSVPYFNLHEDSIRSDSKDDSKMSDEDSAEKLERERPHKTQVFNPGSFAKEYSFVVFRPAKMTCEKSEISDSVSMDETS